MLKTIFAAVLMLFAFCLHAEDVKTDTVMRGYYLPFDSNYMSCKVIITPKGKKESSVNTTGNKISDSLKHVISYLEPGSSVLYTEVTVFKNGALEKGRSRRYVIGKKINPRAVRDPFYPDTLAAKEIAAIVLDKHVYSFSVSWFIGGGMYKYDITGNGVFGEAKAAIEALPSGTKVYFENIRRKEDDGSMKTASDEIHVVR